MSAGPLRGVFGISQTLKQVYGLELLRYRYQASLSPTIQNPIAPIIATSAPAQGRRYESDVQAVQAS